VNVLDLVMKAGTQMRKVSNHHGGEYHGPCPWCGGTDRFHVWPEENRSEDGMTSGRYWCRDGLGHCGKNGDCIQFLRDHEGLSFPEACARLGKNVQSAEKYRAPEYEKRTTWVAPVRGTPARIWADQANTLVGWCYEQLFEDQGALAYLKERGLKETTLARFGLGWNPGKKGYGLFRKRETWGLLPEMNEKTGKARQLWIPIGWIIPCMAEGSVVRIRVRQIDGAAFGPRYYVVPGSSSSTMLIEPGVKSHREVYVIVESELDAILIAQEAGDICGVVALGSASTRPDAATTARLKEAGCILNALDFDAAGKKEAKGWWLENFTDQKYWPVPEAKDPGDAYKAGVNIREWVTAGLPEGLRK